MDGFGRSTYETVYESGLKNGFKDTDVWHYFTSHAEDAEVRCETPFTYNGEKLTGFAVVPLVHVGRDTLRSSNTRELYLGKRNMEDVAAEATGSCDYMVVDSRTGKSITRDEALDEMGKFCAAVSEYPHVEVAGEFQTKKKAKALIYGEEYQEPDATFTHEYMSYLHECADKMEKGVRFVGARKTADELFEIDGNTFIAGNERYSYYNPTGMEAEYRERTLQEYAFNAKKKIASRGKVAEDSFGSVFDGQSSSVEDTVSLSTDK